MSCEALRVAIKQARSWFANVSIFDLAAAKRAVCIPVRGAVVDENEHDLVQKSCCACTRRIVAHIDGLGYAIESKHLQHVRSPFGAALPLLNDPSEQSKGCRNGVQRECRQLTKSQLAAASKYAFTTLNSNLEVTRAGRAQRLASLVGNHRHQDVGGSTNFTLRQTSTQYDCKRYVHLESKLASEDLFLMGAHAAADIFRWEYIESAVVVFTHSSAISALVRFGYSAPETSGGRPGDTAGRTRTQFGEGRRAAISLFNSMTTPLVVRFQPRQPS